MVKVLRKLMVDATKILKEDHVMDGIASMMHMVQVKLPLMMEQSL